MFGPRAPLPGGPGVDAFSSQTFLRDIVVAARPVAARTTLAAWAQDVASLKPTQCRTKASLPAKVGREPAHRWEIHCPDGAHVIKVAAVHEGQGYLFVLVSETQSDAADRAFFASVAATFKFIR